MPEVAAPVATQPELPLQAPPPKAQPSKAARFEIPPDADVLIGAKKETPSAPSAVPKPEVAETSPDAKNTAELAPAADPEAKPEPEDTPEEAAKREERRRQNKLEKAYRQRAEAKARADFLEKQLAEERARTIQPAVDAGMPRLEQFEFDQEKYAKAVTEYTAKKAEKDLQAKQQTAAQEKFKQELVAGWEERVEKAEEKYDDYQQIVGVVEPTSPLAQALMRVENGPDVAYHLGKNLKEANKLAALPILDQIIQIGRISERLSAEPAKPKTPSKAPAPITPVGISSPPVTGDEVITSKEVSDAAWMKARNKQVAARR